jgi:inorganic triphosphatase YgiF
MSEIEAKFRPDDPALLEELVSLDMVGPFRVTGRRTVEQSDEYYDTPAREVMAAHASVRVRSVEGERLFTIKTGAIRAGVSGREEVEEPAGDQDLRTWLARLSDTGRIQIPFSADALVPVLQIENRRTRLDLEDDQGTRIEMAIDRARFVGPRGEQEDQELELELKAGSEERLQEACDWLQSRYPLQPSTASKYHRALTTVG